MSERLIDLSHPLNVDTPPFPGDPPVEVTILDATEQDDRLAREHLNCSRVAVCMHCGTHMDAPYHFYGGGKTIEGIPLETCVGPAWLIDLQPLAPKATITREMLEPHRPSIEECRRVIIHSGWCDQWGAEAYFTDHPVISEEAAEFLVASGCKLIGVDFPSVDRSPFPAHLVLLGNDVVIVENLTNLRAIPSQRFDLVATPLALTGRDGSPVRVVARVLTEGDDEG